MQEYGHKFFEQLMKDEENHYCFDCGKQTLIKGKKPAHWASITNAIYLCLNCASNHRSYGVNISYVRSITIDTWNDNQLRFMAAGGNRRLAELLQEYDVSRTYNKDILYSSLLLDFHRKNLKAEVNGERPPNPPNQRECLMAIINGNNSPNNFNNDYYISNTTSKDRFSSVSSSTSNNSYSNNSNNSSSSWNTSNYKSNNANRFGSVGSSNNFAEEEQEQPTGYLSTFKYYLGSALYKTVDVAYNLKEKVGEMELGSKLKTTVEIIKDTGVKVKDSGAVQTVTKKASDGISYLASKIFGRKYEEQEETENSNSVSYQSYKKQDRDDEYYVKLDEENRKNNYYSSQNYKEKFYSRGPEN